MKTILKTTGMSILSLTALALMLGTLTPRTAEAGIRVRATVSTPHVRVQVGNKPIARREVRRRSHLPVQRCVVHHVSKQDRKIARRLAGYTRVARTELIQLRRQGYSWKEIGIWLEVSRAAVRAAHGSQSWKRFLRNGGCHARHNGRSDRRHVSYRCDTRSWDH